MDLQTADGSCCGSVVISYIPIAGNSLAASITPSGAWLGSGCFDTMVLWLIRSVSIPTEICHCDSSLEIMEEFTIAFGYLRSATIFGPMPLSTKIGFHMQIRSLPEQIMPESPNSIVCINTTWHVKNLELYDVQLSLVSSGTQVEEIRFWEAPPGRKRFLVSSMTHSGILHDKPFLSAKLAHGWCSLSHGVPKTLQLASKKNQF